jgi:hypothetical protein
MDVMELKFKRITVCFVIVIAGLSALFDFEIVPPPLIIIAGCIAGCIVSILILFNGYVIYIGEKILRLYNKPDGEYVILNKWLSWLHYTDIWNIGLKVKKNGNFLELSGIKERYIPEDIPFCSIFCEYSRDFDHFGCIGEWIEDRILFTFDPIGVRYHYGYSGVWLFKLIRKNEDYHNYWTYQNASKHSHNHLMGIYFGGMNHNEKEKIIYNIITQTGENKIIRKEIDEYNKNIIRECYYEEHEWESHYSSVKKITNTKEGTYYYQIWDSWELNFNIKELMQRSGICPRGSFEYGDEEKGVMICYLNGNYFKLEWYTSKSINIEPITLEKYLKVLENDRKYQIEKKNLEEKRRKIIYNIITETGENEIISAEEEDDYIKKYYYYREKHPVYDDKYSSISIKFYGSDEYYYCIEGWEFENFCIEKFMQLNDIRYEKIDESRKFDSFYDTKIGSYYRLNDNCFFKFCEKYGSYTIELIQPIKLEEKKPVLKSAVEYKLPEEYRLLRNKIAILVAIIFITFGLFLYGIVTKI